MNDSDRYIVRCNGVAKRFTERDGSVVDAVKDVSIAIKPGEFAVVVGPNGSGKTTLLRLMAGDLSPDEGSVDVNRAPGGRGFRPAWILQAPSAGSVPDFTVLENMRLALLPARLSPLHAAMRSRTRRKVVERLQHSPLREKLGARAADLSQGQMQLLALEMALARDPSIILADEPAASLDRANAQACLERLALFASGAGVAVVMITHDFAAATSFGDRLVVMNEGCIAADLSAGEKKLLTIADLAALTQREI